MRNLNFVEHKGNTRPKDLAEDTLVVYKTTSTATPESHVHMPMKAGLLNWDNTEQYMGAILEYAMLPKKASELYVDNNDFAEYIPLLSDNS